MTQFTFKKREYEILETSPMGKAQASRANDRFERNIYFAVSEPKEKQRAKYTGMFLKDVNTGKFELLYAL